MTVRSSQPTLGRTGGYTTARDPLLSAVTEQQLADERCRRSLHEYMQRAWSVVEPRPFVNGWHIEAICAHLQAISAGQIQDLIINVPPRHTKSLTVSVMWPSWEWGPNRHPEVRWLTSSYAQPLATRDSVKCRRLIQSSWYQQLWGRRFRLTGDQNAKERYDNDKQGYRLATSVGGGNVGEGGDRLIVDDPNNIVDIQSDAARNYVNAWWDQVMSTRRNDPKASGRVIIMQRSHHKDLTGHILAEEGHTFELLILPAEYEPKYHCVTGLGFSDPRTEPKELLWPARYTRDEHEALKKTMGQFAVSGQQQQRPAPIEGGIFKRQYARFYLELPAKFDFMCQSWDMAFKDLKTSDMVSGQVWGVAGADRYLLDRVADRLSFTKTLQAVRNMTANHPSAVAKYVEDKANGSAVIDTLRHELTGLIAVEPEGGKIARAMAVTAEWEAGNVWLPSPQLAPWVEEFLQYLVDFPNGTYDDDVDAMTQALTRIRKHQVRGAHRAAPVVSLTRPAEVTNMSAVDR